MSKPELQCALEPIYPRRTKKLPHPLPIAHATSAQWFDEIVQDGVLQPTKCTVFGDKRLYLYYGGVYYRSSLDDLKAAM
jgi:hypothetical protein